MADHLSGPRALSDPAADITDVYAFPSSERTGHLVLVLNVFPAASANALFSDAVTYRLRVRPVTVDGGRRVFVPQEDELTLDVTFSAPESAAESSAQCATITTPGGERVPFEVGRAGCLDTAELRAFAGPRLDPFFIDFAGAKATEVLEKLAFRSDATNTIEGLNALSIVLEFDPSRYLSGGSMYAVVGETVTSGDRSTRIERAGRPEMKVAILQPKKFDQANPDLEILDLYNDEDAFAIRDDYVGAYRARFDANLSFFDGLDGIPSWTPAAGGHHPLTELFLADFLVIDMSKPVAAGSCFEIERAVLAGREHSTCGGRTLDDDVVDTIYSLVVGGVDGPRISDGVDGPTGPASDRFPYLVDPNPTPPDLMSVLASLPVPSEGPAA
jgi:hypothetical protein